MSMFIPLPINLKSYYAVFRINVLHAFSVPCSVSRTTVCWQLLDLWELASPLCCSCSSRNSLQWLDRWLSMEKWPMPLRSRGFSLERSERISYLDCRTNPNGISKSLKHVLSTRLDKTQCNNDNKILSTKVLKYPGKQNKYLSYLYVISGL